MKTIFLKVSFTLLCLLFCTSLYSQNEESEKKKEKSKVYNLPPGVVFRKKFNTEYDLSFKIDNNKERVHYQDSELKIAKQITQENLDIFKDSDIENYNYYSTAFKYFNNLSEKVKKIYTKNELWYIYVFDQDLKNKLQTIK